MREQLAHNYMQEKAIPHNVIRYILDWLCILLCVSNDQYLSNIRVRVVITQ